ncbi:MAG TPA: fibronectin type III domain-containing protein [Actinomycetota bacterium]|nr:fibronectin type III domain-containing protein [Actinomycetota bacterium]
MPSLDWFREKPARGFFILELSYLVALLVVGVVYVKEKRFAGFIPDPLEILPVAWFGAVGAVSISLKGVFDHNLSWNPKWNYWHIARPLTGAVLGSIGYLLFVAAAEAATGPSDGTEAGTTEAIVSYLIGFVIGYREETFRELIKRFTDLILSPGGTDSEPPSAPPSFTATVGSGSVTLAWEPSSDNVGVTGYNIYRDTTLLTGVGSDVTQYVDSAVESGNTYRYVVKARDAAGNESSPASASAEVP